MKADLGYRIIRKEMHRTVVFGGLCLASLLVLSAVSLAPAVARSSRQRQRMVELEEGIEVQQTLQPLFVNLLRLEQQGRLPEGLGYVRPVALKRERLLDFDEELVALAGAAGVEAAAVEVLTSTIARTDRVVAEAVFVGDFPAFRGVLLEMGRLEWVHAFKRIDLTGFADQEQMRVLFELALD